MKASALKLLFKNVQIACLKFRISPFVHRRCSMWRSTSIQQIKIVPLLHQNQNQNKTRKGKHFKELVKIMQFMQQMLLTKISLASLCLTKNKLGKQILLVLLHFLALPQGQPNSQHRGLHVLQFLPGEIPQRKLDRCCFLLRGRKS